ncbi:hypothetical protein RB195_013707 [Necator americanus]|uniref:CX domain-containing protein n=1 Tax=Necator americanus TaxID=51031 RepID=A0ABR1DY03_NECAM
MGNNIAEMRSDDGKALHEVCTRLWFTKNPEPQCTPVPVFVQANHRRLFFGNVYNTTGYYFLNAYVFAEYCMCSSGKCCGAIDFREYMLNADAYVYRPISEANLSTSDGPSIFSALESYSKTITPKQFMRTVINEMATAERDEQNYHGTVT